MELSLLEHCKRSSNMIMLGTGKTNLRLEGRSPRAADFIMREWRVLDEL